ncbi:IS630 family transposase [Clostridium sp. Marseille-Q7071]
MVESSSNKLLYAADETAIKIEANNRKSWSPIGHPPLIEKNGLKDGLKLIGATELSKKYDSIVDAYPYNTSITSDNFIAFLQHLLDLNENKKIYMILDNARIHKSKTVEAFQISNKKYLELIYLPPYSPELNPQENVWNRYKSCIHTYLSKGSKDVLYNETANFYEVFNKNLEGIKSLVNTSNYYAE